MKHWNAPKHDRGFTLTEILVTTVILGIVAAISVPNLLGLINQARVTDGVATIEGAIKEAQRQATRLSKTCIIEFGTTTVTNYGRVEQRAFVTRAASVPGVADYSDCLLNDRILPTEVTAVISDTAFPNASAPSPSLTITFSSKGNTTNNDIIKVYHPDISNEKCLVLSGIFGDITTGFHQDTDGNPNTIENCNTN
ncbi:putative Type 4 prepilin-like protein [Hyella patelloides LEGE 07179]|uniref:Putative Type 4 prepilin-like protein n=1 Tax=Hyella patelloides LEGE 07179 TaxID=945734 RepID=A0A563VTM8_9CYAN|nr:prepilin-type N-terminal cleavage/methylation domain-containing protein [Hyella patelloides]VEP14729.1 putative Type 4 prepilin-like protein [Hyella patelloides LEGE 07179]